MWSSSCAVMVKMLVNSKIETTWKKWRPYSVELSRQGYDTRKFVVRGPMLVVVRVTAASDLIERCAEVVDAAATNELEDCSLTYLSGSAAESKLAASVKSRATPYAGLFDPSTNACLFAGSGSLGLLVSVINGVASRIFSRAGWFPAHAAAIQRVGHYSTLIAGGHGAGKTTAVRELLSRFRDSEQPVRVISDDWTLCAWVRASLVSTGLTSSALPQPQGDMAEVGQLILLEGSEPNTFVRPIDSRSSAEAIVSGAYHMPSDQALRVRQLEFWAPALKNIPCFAASYRMAREARREFYDQMYEICTGATTNQ
jgi:hypothetical protein